MDNEGKAGKILRIQASLESDRSLFDSAWRQVAELICPWANTFERSQVTQGEKRTQFQFDATGQLALPKYAAAVVSMTMPAGERWQKLTPINPAMQKSVKLQRWYDEVAEILFTARYLPKAGFEAATGACAMDYGAFGNGCVFCDDSMGDGLRYMPIPMAQLYFSLDPGGTPNRVHRKFWMTAEQIVEQFGNNASEKARQRMETNPLEKLEVIHAVYPNMDRDYKRKDYKGMAFASCYLEVDSRHLLEEGGYRTMPYAIAQDILAPGESYGRGRGMNILPTLQTLNEMEKTLLRAGQRAVNPPIMTVMDDSLAPFQMMTGSVNYGYLSPLGEPLAKPFMSGQNVPLGEEMITARREIINDAFLVSLFRVLVDTPAITATEAMLRAQEKGQLIGPTVSRFQSGLINTLTTRELDILFHAGVLPEVPEEIMETGGWKAEYQSPINQLQKAGAGKAILQTFQAIVPLAQVDPSVMDVFDITAAARIVAESNGYPAKALHTEEEVTESMEAQAEQAQAQQLLAAVPAAASAAKDLAQAQATAGASAEIGLFG